MLWILIGIIIIITGIIIIITALKIPKFGKSLVGLIVIISIICSVCYLYEVNEERISKTLISKSEIELTDLRLVHTYDSSYDLEGRIKNKSFEYTLTGLVIKVTVEDCVESTSVLDNKGQTSNIIWDVMLNKDNYFNRFDLDNKICEVVGEDNVYYYGEDIPPAQTRSLNEYVTFDGLPKARGRYEWSWSITEITGK